MDPRQVTAQAGAAEERDVLVEPQQMHVAFRHHRQRAARVGLDDEQHAAGQADEDAHEQVGGEDGAHGDRERDEHAPAFAPHGRHQRGLGELVAGVQQHGGQRRQRDPLQELGQEQQAREQQQAVQDGRQPGAGPGLHVGRTAHDHRGDRQAAEQACDDVADALGAQFPVGRCHALHGIEPVGGFQAQQRLQAGDEGQGQRDGIDLRVRERRPVGRGELGPEPREAVDVRQGHALRFGEGGRGVRGQCGGMAAHAPDHGDQRPGQPPEHRQPLDEGGIPGEEDGQGTGRDHRGAHAGGAEEMARGIERVRRRGHGAHGVLGGLEAEGHGQLFDDEQQADGREHALDDCGGKAGADLAGMQPAEHPLQHPGQHHGGKEGRVAAQAGDGAYDDHHQPGGRAADAQVGARERAHDEAAHNAGHQPGHEGDPAGESDAQAQRQCHEKDDEARGRILPHVGEQAVRGVRRGGGGRRGGGSVGCPEMRSGHGVSPGGFRPLRPSGGFRRRGRSPGAGARRAAHRPSPAGRAAGPVPRPGAPARWRTARAPARPR